LTVTRGDIDTWQICEMWNKYKEFLGWFLNYENKTRF